MRKLFKSTAIVGGMTGISRVLGFARDMVFAQLFGAGMASDAFLAAFRIPNFFRRLFAEGSFSLAFVPVLSNYKEQQDKAAVKALLDAVSGSLFAILFLIVALGMWKANWVLSIFVPGFADQPEKLALAEDMLRVTFPYLLFISLTGFAGGILNTWGRFAVPALTPALLNISLICAALLFRQSFDIPIKSLAWGVFVAGVFQLMLQIPALIKLGLMPRPRFNFNHPGVLQIRKLMLPTLFSSSAAQLNLLLDTILASFLLTGSFTWLYLADRLLEFPLGVFAIALSTVILPSLSKHFSSGQKNEFKNTLAWASRLGLIIGIPAAVGLGVLAEPIIGLLFGHGHYQNNDVAMAAIALRAYAWGLPAFIFIKILSPAFYSRQDTRTPVKIALVAIFSNMFFNILYLIVLVYDSAGSVVFDSMDTFKAQLAIQPGLHAALAWASVTSAWINVSGLWFWLRKSDFHADFSSWWHVLAKTLPAGLVMGFMLIWLKAQWPTAIMLSNKIAQISLFIGGGFIVYSLLLLLFGVRIKDLRAK